MIDCIKRLFGKKPDVLLMSRRSHLPGEGDIIFGHSYKIGSRRFVEHGHTVLMLNADGTTSGSYYITHWEAL